ncbi:hypothetical protein JCM8547_006457 [Rhodosporidiobolus lusitaniae]
MLLTPSSSPLPPPLSSSTGATTPLAGSSSRCKKRSLASTSSPAWADCWAAGFTRQPSTLSAPSGSTPASDRRAASHEFSAAWPASNDGLDSHDDKDMQHVDDGFELDGRAAPHPARKNSLGLALGEVPIPSFSLGELAYPSPCTPSSSFCGSSSYFPPVSLSSTSTLSASPEPTLPPSPALIPLSLAPAPFAAFSPHPPPAPSPRPAPPSHPLHRQTRLSMTPLSAASLALHAAPPNPRMKQRKGSIVDLPSPPDFVTAKLPPTPPLTPVGRVLELEEVAKKKEEKGFESHLAEERALSHKAPPGVVGLQKRQRRL